MRFALPTQIKEKIEPIFRWLHEKSAPLQLRWRQFSEKSPRLAKWTLRVGLAFGAFLLAIFFFWSSIAVTVPTVRKLRQIQTQIASDVYSADSLLLGRYFKQYRTVIQYKDIPVHVVDALVATEDARFFKHRGVDYRAWGRVLFRTIIQGDRSGGGGSTISQQLAKNLLPRRDFRFFSLPINKMREIVIARRLERAYSKEEILALYLNTVPFPENMYGLDVASRRFFNKPASRLKVEEGAALIGSLRATTFYNPARFPDRVRERRNVVIQQMQKNGYLGPKTAAELQQLPLVIDYNPIIRNEGMAPYFREFARQETERILQNIKKPDGTPYDLYTDGLKVYTTLDIGMQRVAEEAVKEHLSDMQKKFDNHWKGFTPPWTDVETVKLGIRNSRRYQQLKARGLSEAEIDKEFNQKVKMTVFSWEGPKEVEMTPLDSVRYHLSMLQVGFMAMEPGTGYVRAWVGGIDYNYFQYDHVRARRQAGSVFKPVVYTRAVIDSIPPCEQIPNRLIVYHEYAKGDWAIKDWRRDDPEPHFEPDGTDKDDWIPQNADGKYGGSYSLEGALTNSINTVTVALIMRMGVKKVVEMAQKLGITSEVPVEPSIALGTAEVSLYDMIQPFAIFASQGQRVKPVVISRIENHDGEVIYEATPPAPEQVVSPEVAATMTRMLQSVASYGTASRLRWMYNVIDVPVAGKTGTSQNHADGWFIGFTPKLIAGAWVGGDSPLVRFRNFEYGQGAATALPVYARFMRKVLDDPTLNRWHGGEFPALTPEQQKRLLCPSRIPSPEELLADSLARDSMMMIEGMEIVPEGQF